MKSKQDIRKYIKTLKQHISDSEKENASSAVFSTLYTLPEWKKADNILFYHSLQDELPTITALKNNEINKNIFLPKVNGDMLDILPYHSDEISIGAYNIQEPTGNEPISPRIIDLIIVPGVAFDKQFNRLGRGKGYYDKILTQAINATKIGIAFDFQLIDNLPTESHDIKMDIIITPTNLLRK